jgi:hypothetical protein
MTKNSYQLWVGVSKCIPLTHTYPILQRPSIILFEFTPSPPENNLPLRNPIQNGLDMINGQI